ncbi:hypothetical protein ACE1CD_08305 [Aerosakkonema sp. BLCC-F183]|uniref:hypothetical protein n=1 Tax=Aerosakkonema sp. BLCC-F183 TaxID=3342834 RepID=UPI0035BA701D
MTEEPRIPDEETRKRLSKNLRKSILELQEFGLQLEEIEAGLEKHIREQKRNRLEKVRQNMHEISN